MKAITVCNNCGLQRPGKLQGNCPHCNASFHRQTWCEIEPIPEPSIPRGPMLERQIPDYLEVYLASQKAMDLERAKRFPAQWEIDRCEDRMAEIERRFQASGYDISTYL